MLTRPRHAPLALALAAALSLTSCGSSEGDAAASQAVDVVVSFYPLEYTVERIGGDAVSITDLTKPGTEPHDLELTPQDVAAISDADLVVYLSGGFQPAVDDAVAAEAGEHSFDVAAAARLDLEGHGDEGETTADPHFWLDPTRLADVGDAVAERLVSADPENADAFAANAAALRADLEALDTEFTAGLSTCTVKYLVTNHEAFGYLADRYGFDQIGITGLAPEAEPDPATIARVSEFVREHDVTTIYSETLLSPAVAETVAAETGAETAVLDPVAGITSSSAAQDYLGVMRANLATLRTGQSCP